MDDGGVDADALASFSQALSSSSMDGGGDAMVVMAALREEAAYEDGVFGARASPPYIGGLLLIQGLWMSPL